MRVYLDGFEITQFVKDIASVNVGGSVALEMRSSNMEGMVRFLAQIANDPISVSISQTCLRHVDVSEYVAVVTVKYRGGSVSTHNVRNILVDGVGACIFICDEVPDIPDGMFHYHGSPMKFVKWEELDEPKGRFTR